MVRPIFKAQLRTQPRGEFGRETDLHRAAVRLLMIQGHPYTLAVFHESTTRRRRAPARCTIRSRAEYVDQRIGWLINAR